jgi:hypothetical protein
MIHLRPYQQQRGPKPPLQTSQAQACPTQSNQAAPGPALPNLTMIARGDLQSVARELEHD